MYPTSLVFMAYYTLDRHLDDPHQFTRDHQFLSKIKTYNMVAIFCSICLDFNIEYGLALDEGQGPKNQIWALCNPHFGQLIYNLLKNRIKHYSL